MNKNESQNKKSNSRRNSIDKINKHRRYYSKGAFTIANIRLDSQRMPNERKGNKIKQTIVHYSRLPKFLNL